MYTLSIVNSMERVFVTSLGNSFFASSLNASEVEGYVSALREVAIDRASEVLPYLDADNDVPLDTYLTAIEDFVADARDFGFIENVAGVEVINDYVISEVFEDLILGIASRSDVHDIRGAYNIMKKLDSDVLKLNSLDLNATASTLLASHYVSGDLLQSGQWDKAEGQSDVALEALEQHIA